jgi:hypothetical protein
MAIFLLTLVSALLVAAESQASDAATPQGFLSKYLLSDADASKNSRSEYKQLITANTDALYGIANMGDRSFMTLHSKPAQEENSMRFTSAKGKPLTSTEDLHLPKVLDKEEQKAAHMMLASNSNTPISLYTIGVGLLAFVMMLVVRMRRGLQPAGILASSSSPGSDMSINMAPGLADNILEMKSQGQTQGLADNIMDMIEADAQPKHFDPLDLLEGIAKSQDLREAEVNYGRVTMLATSEVEKFAGNMATVAAAAAVALVPTTAFAEVTFVEEAAGIFLGLFPYAAIITIIFGGLIAKLGPALEKSQKLRRTLQLEYSAQKRFLKNTGDIRA